MNFNKGSKAEKWVLLNYNPHSQNFRCMHMPTLYNLAMIECLKRNAAGIPCMVLPYNYGIEFVQNWQKNRNIPVSLCTPIQVAGKMVEDAPFNACLNAWYIVYINEKTLSHQKWNGTYDKAVYETANNISKGYLVFLCREKTLPILDGEFNKKKIQGNIYDENIERRHHRDN